MDNNTKNNIRIISGLLITIVIFALATLAGSKLKLNSDFIPASFTTHTLMLLLSVIVITILGKKVNYRISLPPAKKTVKPVLLGIAATILVNVPISIIAKIFGSELQTHPAFSQMTPLQIFIFVFVYASISEELLFRGFLLNLLNPIRAKGINFLKKRISVSVIISALAFGLAHLILITSGAGGLLLVRIVIFTTVLGFIAGYYQEKYENNAIAIIVHMAGNSPGVLGALLMHPNL